MRSMQNIVTEAGVSLDVCAEMSGNAVQTAMRYGRPKTREKELAAEELNKLVAGAIGFIKKLQ